MTAELPWKFEIVSAPREHRNYKNAGCLLTMLAALHVAAL